MNKLLRALPIVVNIGLESFAHPIREKGTACVQVTWTPPLNLVEQEERGADIDDILSQLL